MREFRAFTAAFLLGLGLLFSGHGIADALVPDLPPGVIQA